ncbi:hypothetical protein ACIQAC_34960 [Streptomyces sp. NPDC088387]|uniref:hypothetical protein n=1 Tax=Streptomyces sp. NPDC088387 TaxID=3365859 RepID=UPI00382DD72B
MRESEATAPRPAHNLGELRPLGRRRFHGHRPGVQISDHLRLVPPDLLVQVLLLVEQRRYVLEEGPERAGGRGEGP